MFPGRLAFLPGALQRFIAERDVIDQTARLADLGHDIIARIDTQRTGDAFHLLAIADVDTHRANIDAGVAVNAIAQFFCPGLFAVLAARFTTPFPIGHGQRVIVHHRSLYTGPGAHVDANLLAHETAKDKGRRGEDENRGIGHRGRIHRDQITRQRRGISEIEYPSPASGQTDQKPDHPFGDPQP